MNSLLKKGMARHTPGPDELNHWSFNIRCSMSHANVLTEEDKCPGEDLNRGSKLRCVFCGKEWTISVTPLDERWCHMKAM